MIRLYFSEVDNAKTFSKNYANIVLGEYLNTDREKLVILKNAYGKPYLRDYSSIHFNISHTKGIIVCAVADMVVGVDIEMVKPFNRRIVERFFTKNEQDYIFTSAKGQNERFTEIWTKKEAYVKWLGKGIAIPFESFDVMSRVISLIKGCKRNHYIISVCGMDLIDDITNQIEIIDYSLKWVSFR